MILIHCQNKEIIGIQADHFIIKADKKVHIFYQGNVAFVGFLKPFRECYNLSLEDALVRGLKGYVVAEFEGTQ